MMRLSEITVMAGFLALVLFENAGAQDIPRYTPKRPTVSPYLNLLRDDTGPLPNYYGLVRPQLNQQAFDNQVSRDSRSQTLSIQKLATISGANSTGPTGTGSVFKNLSHFYPAKQKSSARR